MNKKNIIVALLSIILIIIPMIISMSQLVNAALFNVETAVCVSSWYCTIYSQGNCGNRTCIDTNACGSNLNKPDEFLTCQNTPSSGGGSGGSSGGSGGTIISIPPPKYFTVSTDIIQLSVEQEKVVQKIITINSSSPEDYTLEIQYPSSYTKGTDLLTTSVSSKHIEESGDFNIIIDTRSILVGTYVIPIKIYTKDFSRTISIVIDVTPKNNIKNELSVDSLIKIIGIDKEINLELNLNGIKMSPENNITYSIIDPKGNVLSEEEKGGSTSSNIKETLALPANIEEGYYTLSAKIEDASGTYTKSIVFTVLPPNKYSPVIEEPKKIHYITIVAIVILIIIGLLIAVFNTSLFYKQHKFGKRYKYSKGITMFKFSLGKPNIKISLGTGEGWRRLKEKVISNTPITDPDKRLELLKKSYERGFISLKEYRDALKNQGFTVESNKVAEFYDEIRNKERIEGVSKHTNAAESYNENQHIEILRAKEEQKKEMEKAEKELLKQEEALREEIEQEKRLKEKKIEEEKLEREYLKEKEIKEEIKEIKTEIKETISQPETKVVLTPMSHIISKENILDRRVGDNQAFTSNSGERLYCIRDLLNTLPHMHENVFNHHTKHGRNDFANWIGDVFQYYDVAEQVRDADTKEELIKVLKEYE